MSGTMIQGDGLECLHIALVELVLSNVDTKLTARLTDLIEAIFMEVR